MQEAYPHQSNDFDDVIESIVSPSTERVLQQWFSIVERSVDQTVRSQRLADLLRHPSINLPKGYCGRCPDRVAQAKPFPKGPKGDNFHRYNTPVECISSINRFKTRHVRRLKSYQLSRG